MVMMKKIVLMVAGVSVLAACGVDGRTSDGASVDYRPACFSHAGESVTYSVLKAYVSTGCQPLLMHASGAGLGIMPMVCPDGSLFAKVTTGDVQPGGDTDHALYVLVPKGGVGIVKGEADLGPAETALAAKCVQSL